MLVKISETLIASRSLNSNNFRGQIPPSIGNLSNLYWLDLTDNQIEGPIPVSNETTPGLDMLVNTKHFHLGQNQLSGEIPEQIFSSNMTLIYVLFDSNKLTGPIPSTLGLVQSLLVIRFDNNFLGGNVPSNLNNLTSLQELYLSNNNLNGPLPSLTGMSDLNNLDLSNNPFSTSVIPTWVSSLSSLTTLGMESTQLQGEVPVNLFSLPNLQTVCVSASPHAIPFLVQDVHNSGKGFSNQLRRIDLQKNLISEFNGTEGYDIQIILADNPICEETGATKTYCVVPKSISTYLYTTPTNNCLPATCSSDQTSLMQFFQSNNLLVDSVSLCNPRIDPSRYFLLNLSIFPYGQDSFNRTGVSTIAFIFSNQSYQAPSNLYGPYFFVGDAYNHFSDAPNSPKSTIGIIIGAAVGGSVLLLLSLLAGVYVFRQKKKAERASLESNPFAHWDVKKSNGSIPQLKGARCFSFEELKKYTNNFLEANDIGSGGYGKVYRGTLPNGELVVIKRAQQGSIQGGLEFKTMIELLSRVHHKNVVGLLGFCFERGEQMLIYEYVPNGSLYETLSGKSGIKLDWTKRLKIALGAARGLAYLHELANHPIIHRDIKSTNILLDQCLTAKVADFGLSKPISDSEKGHVTTQVKGTMGYLDPEYYITQQLTEKSDVYSFGVLLLELVTGRRPIEGGKYIVIEVRMALDKTKDLYSLHPILDPAIVDTSLKGLEKFVDLAMSCVEESGAGRPTMGEVVKEIESIMQIAGMAPNFKSATSSSSYEEASEGNTLHPYNNVSFAHCTTFPASKTAFTTKNLFSDKNSHRELPETAEEAKHRAEVIRLRELTLKGHVESVVKLKGLDIDMATFDASTIENFLQGWDKEKPVRYTGQQLDDFTSNYSKRLGSGAYGDVYEGRFPNGVKIAVKLLKEKYEGAAKKQFMAEVGTIGITYHINLVRLYGFCYDRNTSALVYEFMENGSLDNCLFAKEEMIEWEKLHVIAVGTAKGIAYLHEECQQRIIHYDIKPANILLDSNFLPKVADFGLAKLCNRDNTHDSVTGFKGTLGYSAPEFFLRNHPITYKCDVYSFGMLLFEIVGRRKNKVSNSSETLDWFPKVVLDKYQKGELVELIKSYGIKKEDMERAERMSVVALWCVQDSPGARPPMSAVVKMLEGGVEIMPPPKPTHLLFSSWGTSAVKPPNATNGSSSSSSEESTSYWYKETTSIMAKHEIEVASS
ncbi:hypothetical protein SLEP1_g40264 [Rubroshorea leprosula]|uniref:non-specific serine/threonine protein kinase n=1 Tax=Rubroshorea leprosula TaxID=152421 RepID=A0AAV5L491_9ROSI|nr:hypothetical protein SLEP1_g40264 [Rubroshorea leprosula]